MVTAVSLVVLASGFGGSYGGGAVGSVLYLLVVVGLSFWIWWWLWVLVVVVGWVLCGLLYGLGWGDDDEEKMKMMR